MKTGKFFKVDEPNEDETKVMSKIEVEADKHVAEVNALFAKVTRFKYPTCRISGIRLDTRKPKNGQIPDIWSIFINYYLL